VLERECQDLDRILELEMDGHRIDLPNLESLVVLNIPSWGAGVRPWELGSGGDGYDTPKIDDGRLEVFAVYSSFHIAQMQVTWTKSNDLF
jgi:diacylglycerol kinase (ATP)